MKVAVIGAGEMGRWLAKFFKRLGEVILSDVSPSKARKVASELKITARATEIAVRKADLILIAVPISKTPGVLMKVAKVARRGALLVDVASVKSEVVKTMEKIKEDVELVSMHPLFGPGASSLRNKDVVVIPVRSGERYQKFKKFLVKSGAKVTEMDADVHDRAMAMVQCLSHFVLLACIRSLVSLGGMKQAGGLRTPMFSSLTDLAKAALTGRPELYRELQVQNKYARVVRISVMEAFHSLDAAFTKGDLSTVKAIMKEALAQFGQEEVKRAYDKLYRQFEEENS